MAGRFVTFEGIEGSGKSTLLDAVARDLGARGVDLVTTREPGGTKLGDALRAAFVAPATRIDPIAEALLVNASRAQLVAEVIEPALRRGAWVLCDRFADATFAYQGFGRGLSLTTLRELAALATNGRAPDLTFLLDVPVEVSRERLKSRNRRSRSESDRLEREDDGFHQRVRDGYLQLAQDRGRFVVLDGTQDARDVCAQALTILAERLPI